MRNSNPIQGGEIVGEDITLPYLWCSLHLSHNAFEIFSQHPNGAEDAARADVNEMYLLGHLQQIDIGKWHSLCTAAGMTVYGAVALSWCKGADLSQVWEGWEASGFPIKPLPEYERPARFINPALLPATNSLLELARIAENKPLPICAMIVAKGDALDVDLTSGQAAKASPQIAAFLKAHMERKQNRTVEQNQMIEVWAGIVSGTEWEM